MLQNGDYDDNGEDDDGVMCHWKARILAADDDNHWLTFGWCSVDDAGWSMRCDSTVSQEDDLQQLCFTFEPNHCVNKKQFEAQVSFRGKKESDPEKTKMKRKFN